MTRTIHGLIAQQAHDAPSAVALVDGDVQLSYGTLHRRAGDYAARLAEEGVGPGSLVAVSLPRGSRLVTTLLAILQCGAAYAAFDERWPAARRVAAVQSLAVDLLVADDVLAGTDVTWRRPPPGAVPTWPGKRPPPRVDHEDAEAPAMALFTSGTTGRPKAALTPHRALTRLVASPGPLPFGPTTVVPQLSAPGWDVFALEVWGTLCAGGTCVVWSDDYLFPGGLGELVAHRGITTTWLTSSLFNLFVDEDVECYSGLGVVLTGGERLSPSHVRRFLEAHPTIRLMNGYGPVESCVFTSLHEISLEDCADPHGIPIGREVPETSVAVLGDDDVPRGVGEIGELCVAGAGLAVEYVGDPELTREKFPVLDLGDGPVRVYRTGDRAFRDDDGVLHFVGRADRQVKIRGVRVEPVELEVAAQAVPGVGACVAVPVPGVLSGYDRLALVVVPESPAVAGAPGSPAELRRHLKDLLPAHLVPDVIRHVDALPLTAHHKVDHRALLELL